MKIATMGTCGLVVTVPGRNQTGEVPPPPAPGKPSTHLTPYIVINLLLTICPMLYTLHPAMFFITGHLYLRSIFLKSFRGLSLEFITRQRPVLVFLCRLSCAGVTDTAARHRSQLFLLRSCSNVGANGGAMPVRPGA